MHVAFATMGQGKIDAHFGLARAFDIYDITTDQAHLSTPLSFWKPLLKMIRLKPGLKCCATVRWFIAHKLVAQQLPGWYNRTFTP